MRLIAIIAVAAFVALVAFPACASQRFAVRSHAFADGATMPARLSYNGYGCTGANLSPDLEWANAPAGTKSFALTMHDPDAPHAGGWWHWVAFTIPASANGLVQGAGSASGGSAPAGVVEGMTDFGSPGYGGPCPPPGSGAHHYVISVYALNYATVPGGSASTTGPELAKLIHGHVLATATIVGRFSR